MGKQNLLQNSCAILCALSAQRQLRCHRCLIAVTTDSEAVTESAAQSTSVNAAPVVSTCEVLLETTLPRSVASSVGAGAACCRGNFEMIGEQYFGWTAIPPRASLT